MPHTGVPAEPRVGIKDRPGERVAFLLGATPFGTVPGAPREILAQIVARVDGNIDKLRDLRLTKMARLVFTLDREGDLDGGTVIAPTDLDIIGDRRLFRPESTPALGVRVGCGCPFLRRRKSVLAKPRSTKVIQIVGEA